MRKSLVDIRRRQRRARRLDMLESLAFYLMCAVGGGALLLGILYSIPLAAAAYNVAPY